MRSIVRGKKKIFYSLYGEGEAYDEFGNKVKGYSPIKEVKMQISSDKGSTENQAFGKDLDYDREMFIHDINCQIDEYTRLWIDSDHLVDECDYEVKAVAKSINCIRYAIKKIKANNESKNKP